MRKKIIPFVIIFASFVSISPDGVRGASPVIQASSHSCRIRAYVTDPDPKGTNVRSGPGSQFNAVAKIPHQNEEPIVTLSGAEKDWGLLEKAESIEGKDLLQNKGWIYLPLLATNTREKTKIFSSPDRQSKVQGTIPPETEVKLLSCEGEWAKISHGVLSGWIAPESQCPNPVTTCP